MRVALNLCLALASSAICLLAAGVGSRAAAGSSLQSRLSSAGPEVQRAAQQVERMRRESPAANSSSSGSNKKNKSKEKEKSRARDRKAARECLAAHNRLRKKHGVPELKWDDKITEFAQKRSDHIAASDGAAFGHPPNLPFGENLFWHSSSDTACDHMVKGWYDEIKLYDFKAPQFADSTGHFTQLIWRTTERVGCALSHSSGSRGGVYLTCNYDPPGNFLGEFEDNVPSELNDLPAISVARAVTSSSTTARPSTTLALAGSASTTTTTTTTTTSAPTTKPKKKGKGKKKSNKSKGKKKVGEKEEKKKNKKKNKNKKKGNKKSSSTTTSTTTTTTTTTTQKPNANLSAGESSTR